MHRARARCRSKLTNGPNGNIGQDPDLDPAGLQNDGGPPQTIALLPGSPAIGQAESGQWLLCHGPAPQALAHSPVLLT